METTLGQFLNSLPRDTFFVSEAEPDGTRSYYPIEDLEAVPGDDPIWANEVVVHWMDDDTALMCNIKADGLCTVIVSKHSVFVTPPNGEQEQTPLRQPSYLFPLACIDAIMNMAEMLAVLNESWKRDNCLDEKELLREGMEYAQLDFDRPQPPLVHWTDDEPRYQRIFAVAYARRYRDLVRERRVGGQSQGRDAY